MPRSRYSNSHRRRSPPPLSRPPRPDPFAGLSLGNDPFANVPPPPPLPYNIHQPSSCSDSGTDEVSGPLDEGNGEPGMTAEARHLYRENGRRRWRTKRPDKKKLQDLHEKNSRFAIVVRREKDFGSELGNRLHSFTVQSPLLRDFLGEVFQGYHGVSTKLNDLTFHKPFQEFVHRWDRLEDLTHQATEETQLQHIELLSDVLEPAIKPLVLRKREMVEQNIVSFQLLWTLFEPYCEIYSRIDDQDRIFQLQSCSYEALDSSVCLAFHCRCIDYDGKTFGFTPYYLNIEDFDGYTAITDLDVIPLHMHPDREGLTQRLTARGKRFEQLQGFSYHSYTGMLEPNDPKRRAQKAVNRRVIVDAEMYHSRSDDSGAILAPLHEEGAGAGRSAAAFGAYTAADLEVTSPPAAHGEIQPESTVKQEKHDIQESQYRFCTSLVKGYCLKSKLWIKMDVDGIGEIEFNPATFKHLILPNDNKELILTLVESHLEQEMKFDDIVEGKGKGMVVLLSGEPGIGKTLTAEAVAEQMRKPLFSMSAGQLGPEIEDVEDDLDDILEICAHWGAVLLLDEADVFLEKRSLADVRRNKLVSVFLRLLEYHEGCMFLTTNRATTLDPAIRSRIDLHVDYGALDTPAKRRIWKTFVHPSEDFPSHGSAITDAELDVLARLEINGRDIKNLVKTGRLLARRKGEELDMGHLKTVLSVQTGVPMI